ncbi:MAG: hypothetical protein ACT4OV_11135 [Microthrixaceae bacterium]
MGDGSGDPPWDDDLARRFTARLERWATEVRVDEAARVRSRERWLAEVADQEATLAGVLIDFAERHVPVLIHSVTGRHHHGRIRVLGVDFVGLALATGAEVLVARAAVVLVRTAPTVDAATGDRMVTTELRLADVLAGMAADRERVRLVTREGDATISGELRSVGHDVVVLRTDRDRPGVAYVPLDAIAEVTL